MTTTDEPVIPEARTPDGARDLKAAVAVNAGLTEEEMAALADEGDGITRIRSIEDLPQTAKRPNLDARAEGPQPAPEDGEEEQPGDGQEEGEGEAEPEAEPSEEELAAQGEEEAPPPSRRAAPPAGRSVQRRQPSDVIPLLTAEDPGDVAAITADLDAREEDRIRRYNEGELSEADNSAEARKITAERMALDRKVLRYELATEVATNQQAAVWREELGYFLADHPELNRKSPRVMGQWDQFVSAELEADEKKPLAERRSHREILDDGYAAFRAEFYGGPKAAPRAAPPSDLRAAPASRNPEAALRRASAEDAESRLPQTLRRAPASDGNEAGDDPDHARLDRLMNAGDTDKFEAELAAFEKKFPERAEAYLGKRR